MILFVVALSPLERWTRTRVHFYEGRVAIQFDVKYDVTTAPRVAPDAIEVRCAGPKGRGSFATQRIPAGTYLGVYEGDELDFEQFQARYSDSEPEYVVRVDSALYLDGRRARSSEGFTPALINHGRSNVVRYCRERRPPIIDFFTASDLEPGDELLMDYGAQYWIGRALDKPFLDPANEEDEGWKNILKDKYNANPATFEAAYIAIVFSALVFVGQLIVRWFKYNVWESPSLNDMLDYYQTHL